MQNLLTDLLKLRPLAQTGGLILSGELFARIREHFLDHTAPGEGDTSLASWSPEYEREEFLLVLHEDGAPCLLPDQTLHSFEDTCIEHPGFARWFQLGQLPGSDQRVLLAGRWLCHLLGLRHGTVEIFLDPPGIKDHTLVQVRGIDKFEAPGAFDIPCAGHITGTDTLEESLQKELAEELNLKLDDLHHVVELKRYNSYTVNGDRQAVNAEYRVLFRAELKREGVERIRFTDGEVAGLAVFSVPELRSLIAQFPERTASGLSGAISYYI